MIAPVDSDPDLLFIGVDPGLAGAVAVLDGKGRLVRIGMMPRVMLFGQERAVVESFDDMLGDIWHPGLAVRMFLESIQICGKQTSKVSLRSSSIAWGFIAHAAIIDPRIGEVTCLSPSDWQPAMIGPAGEGPGKKGTKDRARERVLELWPDFDWPKDRKGVIRDGAADAALIAEFGRRFGDKKGGKQ